MGAGPTLREASPSVTRCPPYGPDAGGHRHVCPAAWLGRNTCGGLRASPTARGTIRRPAAPAEHRTAGCLQLWGEPIFPGSRWRRTVEATRCSTAGDTCPRPRYSDPRDPISSRGSTGRFVPRGAPHVALRFPCTPRCPPGVGYTPLVPTGLAPSLLLTQRGGASSCLRRMSSHAEMRALRGRPVLGTAGTHGVRD